MTMPPVRKTLIVGLGSPDRGDDAVGPKVAHRIAALGVPGVRVAEQEDPTSIIELWDGCDLAIVIDAVCSNGIPGTLTILECGAIAAPLPEHSWARTGRGGTHAFGLAAAVELARALHRLPDRVVVIGVEAGGLEHGEPLSAPVAAAVARAVEAVIGTLWETAALPCPRTGANGWATSAPLLREVSR